MDNTVYANGIQCTFDDSGREMTINFLLTTPIINDAGALEAKTRTVSNVVMTREMAESLRDSLDELIQKTSR